MANKKRQARPSLPDKLIIARESLLNRLSGAAPDLVLNQVNSEQGIPPADLASRIKETLDLLKAAAMSADGAKVDYAALRSGPAYTAYRQDLLGKLGRFQPQALPGLAARRAFWINLYNALVIDAVIAFDIHSSVTEGLLGILRFFRRAAYIVGGRRVSLEDMEHGILRANRGNPYIPGAHFSTSDPRRAWSLPLDPRIHFALNCGGLSCPPIRSYTPESLEAQLDLAARSFVNAAVEIFPERKEVHLSQIFRWYQSDFGSHAGLIDFLIAHLPQDERRDYLAGERQALRLVYTPYDWRLNRQ